MKKLKQLYLSDFELEVIFLSLEKTINDYILDGEFASKERFTAEKIYNKIVSKFLDDD